MSETTPGPLQEVVTGIVKDYVGKYLSKTQAAELVGRLVKGVLMTRQGAGLSEEPGTSTTDKPQPRRHVVAQPEPKKEPEHLDTPTPGRKVVAVVSHPYDGPIRGQDESPGSMPFTVEVPE